MQTFLAPSGRACRLLTGGLALLAVQALAGAGPFPPAAGQEGSTAIHMEDESIVAWATGWTNYVHGENLSTDWTNVVNALGPATGDTWDVVSLGDGGQITMTFDTPIVNGPGYDFAVFGNSFNDHFLELAYVEVSSDGIHFHRFHNESLTTNEVPFLGAHMDPALIDGLAGKYRVGYGIPFDLNELADEPNLDVHDIRYVRLVDIIGDGSYTDSVGRVIYDPHPTTGSAGFDLEAVAVLNEWTPFHAWRVEHFGDDAGSDDAAESASWVDDGVPNLLKYALNRDPLETIDHPLFTADWVEHEGQPQFRIRYTRRRDMGHFQVRLEWSPDLTGPEWFGGADHVAETVISADDEVENVEAIILAPSGNMGFVRIGVK